MGKLEDFGKVIKVVTELTDVSEEAILGKSRVPEVVDARWMVIILMREQGYTPRQIAPLLCHPVRTINNALASFDDRAKYVNNCLKCTLAVCRQLLGNKG